ncbi:radical SAM peptide maturase, CXXX-repeat target family [Lachnotalea glycerini]|uniref:Radical SAM peptide maturase, CXXX-repeat target family n=1 Tax=Lachnotalea glycerini TaxID=1763509 RepID=A0A371JKI0_9FIRM|nr:radical SAM peptide maturase, CXXX-repeat target family [Lachnotalea glycerini]RDY33231.1 radical SAM peptide maturase, CXXX-repeat target family [Lachnotalea glycerini]
METSKMGKNIYMWRDGAFQSIEFVVTQECNMRCKYCYMIGKNENNVLSLETAKNAIDYILSDENEKLFEQDALAINFIGGEPLLEIDLIDQICDYFKIRLYEKEHKWFNLFMINIGSNGLLYENPKVQKFLQKNRGKVSINITIDGIKEKHDMQRVYPDGAGTYEDVLRNVKLWLKQAPLALTKVTIGHDDIKYLKDSIIYLWNLGMKDVPANIVFENVWEDGDDEKFYLQLKELADYIVDNHLWDTYNTTLFSERLGKPLSKKDLNGRECGSGGMITIDASGKFYPCVRFMDYSLEKQKSISIGDIENGLNLERIRSFVNCDLEHQSDEECLSCNVASDCSHCLAHNYDVSDNGTLFQRNKHICKMHKARVRANNYYWARLEKELGMIDKEKACYKKNLFIILDDNSSVFCNYNKRSCKEDYVQKLSEENLQLAVKFADTNFFNPILLHSDDSEVSRKAVKSFENQRAFNIYTPSNENKYMNSEGLFRKITSITHDELLNGKRVDTESSLLIVDSDNLKYLSEDVKNILINCMRINIIARFDYKNFDFQEYEKQLDAIVEILYTYFTNNEIRHVDVITDNLFFTKKIDCAAGVDSFTLAPNGYLYTCPAVYFTSPEAYVGTLTEGINEKLLKSYSVNESPVCSNCQINQCKRCVYQNKKLTGEHNTPSSVQCKKSKIELKYASKLSKLLKNFGFHMTINSMMDIDGSDPLERLIAQRGNLRAYKYEKLF